MGVAQKLTLFQILGNSIEECDEKTLLSEIRNVAVKWKNTAVHRQEFYNTKQEDGQTTQQFLAKLKSKAEHCSFQLKCTSALCNHQLNSYTSSMVADILTVGCFDEDIQSELLARASSIKTLEEKLELMQALVREHVMSYHWGPLLQLRSQHSSEHRSHTHKCHTPKHQQQDVWAVGALIMGQVRTSRGNITVQHGQHHVTSATSEVTSALYVARRV